MIFTYFINTNKTINNVSIKKIGKQLITNKKQFDLFKIIGKKFGLAIQSLTDILAFTFLSLPVMNIIRDLADHKGFNIDRVDDLLMGLTLSAGAYTLKNVMKRK